LGYGGQQRPHLRVSGRRSPLVWRSSALSLSLCLSLYVTHAPHTHICCTGAIFLSTMCESMALDPRGCIFTVRQRATAEKRCICVRVPACVCVWSPVPLNPYSVALL